MSEHQRRLATAELLGALAYGQLRGWATAARVVPLGPTLDDVDALVGFADRERQRYQRLRDRLDELTDLPDRVVERQRAALDRYFESLALSDWLGATVFLAVGLPMAADFARAVAPVVDEATADVVLDSLASRGGIEEFARDSLRTQLADPDDLARARSLVADVVGSALTAFSGSLGETDALQRLFADHAEATGTDADEVVKRVALRVLEQHRRRMLELGLDDLE